MAKILQHQIISRALEIIADERRWTRGGAAVTHDGDVCAVQDILAERFCALGALLRACQYLLEDSGYGEVYEEAYKAAKHVLAVSDRPNDSLPGINDAEGRDVIVEMFKRALAS